LRYEVLVAAPSSYAQTNVHVVVVVVVVVDVVVVVVDVVVVDQFVVVVVPKAMDPMSSAKATCISKDSMTSAVFGGNGM
jgi:hypothetical protein